MALWDIKGKALGLPVFQLFRRRRPNAVVTPYASLLAPRGRTLDEYPRPRSSTRRCGPRRWTFRAVKPGGLHQRAL